jgi:hypothetical protein
MKINKSLTFATLAAMAVAVLFQTQMTRADDHDKAVPPSNPFVILLDGYWEPAGEVPGNLGLDLPHLSNGVYKEVTIYNIDSGFPGPTDEVVGTAYALGGEGFIAYNLRKGALTAKFVEQDTVTTVGEDGSMIMTGTWELDILEATGIYRSFVGGHIHMVDVLKFNADRTILEHCFCHISREHGKP